MEWEVTNLKFEVVSDIYRKFKDTDIYLPVRSTKGSVGYDFFSNESIIIPPHVNYMFWTDIKAKLEDNEALIIIPRSSIGIKKHLMLANTIGVIDPDYYENEDNDGNIGICLYNYGNEPIEINEKERIAQGIIIQYNSYTEPKTVRRGGFGSTNSIVWEE